MWGGSHEECCVPSIQLNCVHLFRVKGSLGLKQSLTKSEALKGCPNNTCAGDKTLGLGNCLQLTSFAADLKGDSYTKT